MWITTLENEEHEVESSHALTNGGGLNVLKYQHPNAFITAFENLAGIQYSKFASL